MIYHQNDFQCKKTLSTHQNQTSNWFKHRCLFRWYSTVRFDWAAHFSVLLHGVCAHVRKWHNDHCAISHKTNEWEKDKECIVFYAVGQHFFFGGRIPWWWFRDDAKGDLVSRKPCVSECKCSGVHKRNHRLKFGKAENRKHPHQIDFQAMPDQFSTIIRLLLPFHASLEFLIGHIPLNGKRK